MKEPINSTKSFYITTLGCPKNTTDSMQMEFSMIDEGLVPAHSAEESDFHIINTCSFIKSATEETIDTILNAAKVKKQKNQRLIVAGCFSQRYPEEIKKDIPEVDLIFGTGKYNDAGKIIKEKFKNEFSSIIANSDFLLTRNKYAANLHNLGKPFSYIKISDGCNRGCHFCIIPTLRGEFKSSSRESILENVKLAVSNGAKEICVISQDTVFYARDIEELKSLLNEMTEVPGVELVRILYLYPDKKTEKLLDIFLENKKIAPYLESPIQHISERILKLMNRTGSPEFIKELFAKARRREGLEIRTSIIMGYPTETANDVDMVLDFIEEVKPEKLALFPFSPEEGTKAFKLKGKINNREIANRINLARDTHLNVLKQIHASRIGKVYDAISEESGDDGIIARRFQDAPEIDEIVFLSTGKPKSGTIGKVRIDSFLEYDMEGTWIN